MDLFFISRQPLRLPSAEIGARRTSQCESRGYCGPFANEALYNAFPEPIWHGMGDCLECGTTCHVPRGSQGREDAPIASVA